MRDSFTLAVLAGGLIVATGAAAAPRTFVATTGADASPCSIAAPCRSFAAAQAQTSPGGEIVVLDSGGYGALTAAQSLTLTAPEGVYAGISVFAGVGVTVNAPADAVVTLRGLTINGQGGSVGISLLQAAELRVERCRISAMTDSGIVAQLGAGAALAVNDSVISRNANAGIRASGAGHVSLANVHVAGNGAFGILFQDVPEVSLHDSLIEQNRWGIGAFSSADNVVVGIANCRIFANQSHGVWANSAYGSGTNVVSVTVTDSEIVRNNEGVTVPSGGIFAQAALQQSVRVSVVRTRLSYNHGAGLYLQLQFPSGPASATAYVTQSLVQGNTGYGVTTIGPAIAYTTGDNTVEDNPGGDLNGNIVAYPGPT